MLLVENKVDAFNDIKSLAKTSLGLLKLNFNRFLIIALAYHILSSLPYVAFELSPQILKTHPPLRQLITIALLIAYSIAIHSILIISIVTIITPNKSSYSELSSALSKRLLPLIIIMIQKYVVIFFWTLMLIVPGIICACRYSMVEYFAIFKNNSFKKAALNSDIATNGYKYALFKLLAILYSIAAITNILASLLASYYSPIFIIIGATINTLISASIILTTYQLWHSNIKKICNTQSQPN